jgi:V/A-type H+/Na+-transporting ATPase subunit K
MLTASMAEFVIGKLTVKRSTRKSFSIVSMASIAIMLAIALSAHTVYGQTTTATAASSDNGFGLIAAAIAITGSCAAAGYAVAKAASAAAAAIVERPGAFGPMLILAGLGEGIAIYGLLVAFQILSKI